MLLSLLLSPSQPHTYLSHADLSSHTVLSAHYICVPSLAHAHSPQYGSDCSPDVAMVPPVLHLSASKKGALKHVHLLSLQYKTRAGMGAEGGKSFSIRSDSLTS